MWLTLFICAGTTIAVGLYLLIGVGLTWQVAAVVLAALLWIIPWMFLYLRRRDYHIQLVAWRRTRHSFLYKALLPTDAPVIRPMKPSNVRLCMGLMAAFIVSVIAFAWYAMIATEQGTYTFSFFGSPCGQSSCSRATNQHDTPYNPLGYFPDPFGANLITSLSFAYCPCPGCRWADSNGNFTIFGYPGQPGNPLVPDRSQPPVPGGLATTNPNDYPNLAVGLGLGVYPGFGYRVINVVACPGTTSNVNPATGIAGLGAPICALCTQYFRDWYGYADPYVNASCPPNLYPKPDTYGYLCWACPPINICPKVPDIAHAYMAMSFGMLLAWMVSLFNC